MFGGAQIFPAALAAAEALNLGGAEMLAAMVVGYEAVLACQAGGPSASLRTSVGAFLGGSCAETDLSARVAVHVALATQSDIIMAKPGMGVDEGITVVQNEMTRALAWIRMCNA